MWWAVSGTSGHLSTCFVSNDGFVKFGCYCFINFLDKMNV